MKKKIKKPEIETVEKVTISEKNINKAVSVYLALLVLVLAALGYGYYRYWNVAIVNGQPISRIAYIQTMEKQGGKAVLDRMVQETLVRSEAKKKGVQIQQQAIDEEIKKIETQITAMGQTMDEALKAEGITRAQLEDQIRMQKMVEVMANANAEVTQAQIDDFIEKNKDQFPKGTTKEEMQSTAKEELTSQAGNEAISKWLAELNKNAKITYK
ncbi:MAG: SurA N-terminal domain-containing protein [Candidatus Shapirobacteria bacterium]|jgi:enamine deaminase RidA (YjgF/YER057c/UK114 family)